ncbi:MAG: class I mannose-6-phosphate isomerase [Pirellulaceae bacterium]|nr:class I mannose-6-phosphate isomerase [Pirellulaceae bacterium]
MPTAAYPLRLIPTFRNYIWGGRKLATHLNKSLPDAGIWAESWEVVDHPEHDSQIANGPLAGQSLGSVMRDHPAWLIGQAQAVADRFPLLLKYLDCNRVLSVQVHPDDDYALRMTPPDLGKTEAWYIIHAEPGAVLYAGLKPGFDAQTLGQAIAAGQTAQCMHVIEPEPGDCIFIPAGTVHALGAGLIVAEIQQSSNTTFRLYDWDRVDHLGQSRPLHVRESLATIDYASGPRQRQTPQRTSQSGRVRLVECDKFRFDRISNIDQCVTGGDGQFHILTVPTGQVTIQSGNASETLTTGQSILLPASIGPCQVTLAPNTILLEASA